MIQRHVQHRRAPRYDRCHCDRARSQEIEMGDKSPKSSAKQNKQKAAQRQAKKSKAAPAAVPASAPKGR
jgi:hypothetical protein